MEKLCKHLEDKLCALLYFLTKFPCILEMMAEEIENENLRDALCAVASESGQYAKELYAHLRWPAKADIVTSINNPDEGIAEKIYLNSSKEKGNEVLLICNQNESFFSEFYIDLLDNHLPDESLKKMLHYQLAGIRSAFTRIRFLNSSRFVN